MGLKEAGEFALELKKAERAKEVIIIKIIIAVMIIAVIHHQSSIKMVVKRFNIIRLQSREPSAHGQAVGGAAAGSQKNDRRSSGGTLRQKKTWLNLN